MKKYCKSHDSIFVYLQSLKKLVYKYLAATILLREHGIREHQYPESPHLQNATEICLQLNLIFTFKVNV